MPTCGRPEFPSQQTEKICEACGKAFLCGPLAGGCWCEEISLSSAARSEIASQYQDCLCRNCLKNFADKT